MTLIGEHHFIAYEGDLEYKVSEKSGLLVPQNPIVWVSPVYRNIIVDTGRQSYIDRLQANTVPAFTVLGVGTDSTATGGTQSKLNPSVTGSVYLQTVDATFPSRAGFVGSWKATYASGVANFNWNEAGIFNGLTNGTSLMFNRVLIGPFNKTAQVAITYTATLTQN